jgi:hypothetical protein
MRNPARKIIGTAVCLGGLLGLAAPLAVLSYVRPLIPADDYALRVTVEGAPARATLLKPFPSGAYYIRLDDEFEDRYGWFGVAFERKAAFSPVGVYSSRGGFHYVHADQDTGVHLTDMKMDDEWVVEFTGAGVIFENASIRVELMK